jgi:serine/threonine protein kinase
MSLLGQTIGNYRITRKLGEGGMGAVYLGEHPLIGKKVAIKVLREELAQKPDIVHRFFNEAKAVNDIGHQNIVDIVDFGRAKAAKGEVVYFIMEFLEGESLASRLQRVGVSFDETRHILRQACSALAASHAKKIVHRDLKPENIHLISRGRDASFVKILDFGIAKLHAEGGSSHQTRTGMVIGTPAYMSPEQCEGRGRIDHRSDVYSLGVVMYELLVGRVPFTGEGFGETLVAHMTQAPTPPTRLKPEITPELEAIVLHALEKDPARRFQSMDELAAALENPTQHLAGWQPKPRTKAPVGLYQGSTLIEEPEENVPIAVPVTRSEPNAPPATTLSGAASEISKKNATRGRRPSRPSRGSPRSLMIAGVVGLAVFVVGAAGLLWLRSPKPAASPTPTPPAHSAPAVPLPALAPVDIVSNPPGATVERGGQVLGATPLRLVLPANQAPFPVVVRAPDHAPKTVTVTPAEPMLRVELLKLPSAEALRANVPPPRSHLPPAHPPKPAHGNEKSDARSAPAGAEDPDTAIMPPSFVTPPGSK